MVSAIGLVAAVILVGLVVLFAVMTANPGARPAAPVGLPPDPGAIESMIREALSPRDASSDPALDELARVYAFAMASRGIAGGVDPEGEDHWGRRLRLHPRWIGWSAEWCHLVDRAPGELEPELVRKLLSGRDDPRRLEADAPLLSVGVAVEGSRCAAVVIRGARWGELSAPVPVAEDSGELRVDGVRGEPSLGASACVDGGPWSTVPIEADDAGAFSLAIDIPAGATRAALRFEAGGRQDKERVIR